MEPVDKLLHVGDLHFWHVEWNPLRLLNKRALGNFNVWLRRRHRYDTSHAGACIEAFARTKLPFALFTGDFTSTATDEEFRKAQSFVESVADRGFRLALMAGNHDVYTFESVRKKRFEKFFEGYLPEGGYPSMVQLPGGTPLLLLPTACPNVISSKGFISVEAINGARRLLDEELPNGTVHGAPIVVAGHYPVLNKTYAYRTGPSRQLRNGDALRKMLGESGRRILYVAGHVHRFSYVQDPQYEELAHLTSGALFYRNRREAIEGDFSEIHVAGDGFAVYRHTWAGDWKRGEEGLRTGKETGTL